MKTNIVVGAGFSGAVIANLIASIKNEKVLVIDRRTNVAGNHYDYRDKNGIMVQKFGSHVFHTSNEKVWNYLKHFTDFNQYMHKVTAVIDGQEVDVPFNLNTLHKLLPNSVSTKIEEKLIEKFGYNKKVTLSELIRTEEPELALLKEYLTKKLSLKEIYIGKDSRYYQDKYQGIPLDGYTAVVERMLMHPNIELRLGIDFREVTAKFDRVFYTGAIDEYFNYELGQLPYKSAIFKLEEHEREFYQAGAVIEYPENYDFTRIHEYKHYLNDKSAKTIIAKEYLVNFEPNRTERTYPAVTRESTKLYNKYLEKANALSNVYFLGTLGDYKCYELDETIARAIEVFENLDKKQS